MRAAVSLLAAAIVSLSACGGGSGGAAPVASSPSSTSAAASVSASAAGTVATITAADLPDITALGTPGPQTPQRIVSLATGVGETLVALGVGDRVVGRDETSGLPAQAEIVTKAHNVSAEKVISLKPDLVIVDARTTPPEAVDQIKAAGARIVTVPEAWTLGDMVPRTTAVAEAVGVDPAPLLATIPTASPSSTPDAPRVAFLYLRGTSGIYLLGGKGSGADALISAAGGVDVGAEAGLNPFVPLTAEALAQLDPEVVLVMTKGLQSVNGVDGLVALPGVAQTTAGRERRVIAVDDEILLSFGPRTGALITKLSEALAQVTG